MGRLWSDLGPIKKLSRFVNICLPFNDDFQFKADSCFENTLRSYSLERSGADVISVLLNHKNKAYWCKSCHRRCETTWGNSEDQGKWWGPPCHIDQRLKDSPRQNNFFQAAHSLEHCWRPRRSPIWPGNSPPSHHLLHKRYFDNNWSKGHLGPLALFFWNIIANSVKSVAANVYDSWQRWDVWLSAAGLVQDLWVDNLQGAPVWTIRIKFAGLGEGVG